MEACARKPGKWRDKVPGEIIAGGNGNEAGQKDFSGGFGIVHDGWDGGLARGCAEGAGGRINVW